MAKTSVHTDVQNYYGQELQQTSDLKTDACCSKAQVPLFIQKILHQIHPDVVARYYGCGLVFPPKLDGCRVLDLGCGSGRDVFILSNLVEQRGYVVGVDMTPEQLDVARRFVAYHTKEFGFEKSNVEFRLGQIEQLTDDVGLDGDSFDVVVSNCVVNLSPDKKRVLQQVYRVLKPGGEFYFSDVYADRVISEELRQNKILWGECLSGALCENDLIMAALDVGFTRPQLVTTQPIGIENLKLQELLGDIKFASCTYRMFKNNSSNSSPLSRTATNALVTYETPMIHYENEFRFDQDTIFKFRGKPQRLNAEHVHTLAISRYAENFKITPIGDEEPMPDSTDNVTTDSSSVGCCRQGVS